MCHICINEKENRKASKLNLVEKDLRIQFFELLETKGPGYVQDLFNKEMK